MSETPPPRSWLSPAVEVRLSAIEGDGLFASRAIAADEEIARLAGQVITEEQMRRVAAERARYSAVRVDAGHHLLMAADDPAARGNHSCAPSAWMSGGLTLVARREIEAGEEITIDYALLTDDPEWRITCQCGSTLCRGAVTGLDWQRPELQARYRGHFTPWIELLVARSLGC